MNILIAPDSFKGSLSATEAARAIADGVSVCAPEAVLRLLPLADGGEGTAEVLCRAKGGVMRTVTVHDPLCRPTSAQYALCKDTAVIETAQASGLLKLSSDELAPCRTTSFGSGELLLDALNQGVSRILLGLGGSATNDGGKGLLTALGARFLDEKGQELPPGGEALLRLHRIDCSALDPRLKTVEILIASDVTSPLTGEHGATRMFSAQKGATAREQELLEQSLKRLAAVAAPICTEEAAMLPGSGAAGGLGYALAGFLGAVMESGFSLIAREVSLSEKIREADVVITGEGKTDASSLLGKLPVGVATLCRAHAKPCVLLSGDIDCEEEALSRYFSVWKATRLPGESVESAMRHASERLRDAARALPLI